MSNFSNHIFRDYDIRGIYRKDFDESFAYDLGVASCLYSNGGRIVIGHDFRNGSDSLSQSFSEGAVNAGCDIVDIGNVPVPVLYYASKKIQSKIGVMVTASHLPAGWNGFKFCDHNGIPISADNGLNNIRNNMGFNRKKEKIGSFTHLNISESYSEHVTSLIKIKKELKVIFDYGDSVTSLIVPLIARKLKIDYYEINNSRSGDFPNRTSELTPSSMAKLGDKVIEKGADVGIAYDGDGDRFGLVDAEGKIYYSGNSIIQLFCILMPSSLRNKAVIYDVTCSGAVKDTIIKSGGIPIESRVGQSYIAKLAIANGAIFGGQYSCHNCFQENDYIDDAIYSSFKFLDLLSSQRNSLSALSRYILDYPHTEIENITVEEKVKKIIIEKIETRFKETGYNDISRLDGLKVELDDCWCLIRPSNTSPVIRVNAEGKNAKEVEIFHKICSDIVKGAIKNDQ